VNPDVDTRAINSSMSQYTQLRLDIFPSEEAQVDYVMQVEDAEVSTNAAITQEDIEEALLHWNGDEESRVRIYALLTDFVKARSIEAAQTLRHEYAAGRVEAPLQYSVEGLHISKPGANQVIIHSWENVQKDLLNLIANGSFIVEKESSINNDARDESKGESLWRQYQSLSAKAENAILFLQSGDYYVVLGNHATVVSKELGLSILPLVRVPGITGISLPIHTGSEYINKLVSNGHHVAIAELINEQTQEIETTRIIVPEEMSEVSHNETLEINETNNEIAKEINSEGSPPPVFFVDWQNAQHDFDLTLYKDNDVIGFDKDGVKYTVRSMDNLAYVTTSTGVTSWGQILSDADIPQNILMQMNDYKENKISGDDVQNNYLNMLSAFKIEASNDVLQQSPASNFQITDPHLGEGGPKTKYAYNVEAIRLIKILEEANRPATKDEQKILSRYVGWGGIQEVFDENKSAWAKEYQELRDLLTESEYNAARSSTINAHYTSPTVIEAMYDALHRLGVEGGNILEPSCGTGNFIGLMPERMKAAKMHGIELDEITGRIAQKLYPDATILNTGYERTSLPDNFFDVAIGNVPFGGYGVSDKKYDRHKFMIHDYFFAKSLDQIRPGGIVAFITSKGTLDKANPKVRKYIAERAELLGAIRLPNNAFLKNAGTQVTSDIIFLQKREAMSVEEPSWVHLDKTADGIPINRYFTENPHMVLGKMSVEDGNRMYGSETSASCMPIEGAELKKQLQEAIIHINGRITEPVRENEKESDKADILPADPSVKNFGYTLINDEVYLRENSFMYKPDKSNVSKERIKGMIDLRDTVRTLIDMQLGVASEDELQAQRQVLNEKYDTFTKKYGLLNEAVNARAFNPDTSYFLLASLEVIDENGKLERKSDMFTKRTINQKKEITAVDTSADALAVSISEKGTVDLEFMERLVGKSREIILEELQGIVFLNVGATGNQDKTYVTADEYLSGNVRKKLEYAQAAHKVMSAAGNDSLAVNIAALEAVQPPILDATEIGVRLGASWVDREIYEKFMHELLQPNDWQKKYRSLSYSEATGEWYINGKRSVYHNEVNATITYGTSRANAYTLLEHSLNNRNITVKDRDDDGRYHLNKKETILARQKQDAIKEAFKEWVYKDPDRRQMLVAKYNELFNSTRVRQYDGSHILFSESSPEIQLRKHQKNAIARIMYGGNTLLAHEVGAGKTFEMIGAVMESKKIGLCSKAMMAVPNHLTEDIASEFMRLYPTANILVATKKDFETKNRKTFCARIATGDYDCVIIGHSQFEKIPLSVERQAQMIDEQLAEITKAVRAYKDAKAERFTIKQMETMEKRLKLKLEKLYDATKKDDVVTFEELGIDRLLVDEAHNYKNLPIITKMRGISGITTTEVKKASDMFMKIRYMDEKTDGKGVIFATGTPISNSMAEMYTMQKYLQYNTLREKGMLHFDNWASNFGEVVNAVELSSDSKNYKAKLRFSKFQNLPELMTIFGEVADIKTADMLDLPRPIAHFHTVVAEPTEIQKKMVEALSERATLIQNRAVSLSEDNMLKITMDGRKIGIDQRMVDPNLPDDPSSKVNQCMENVYKIWDESKANRLTQIIFSDYSTPNKDGRFNVYTDIRDKLLKKGIPKEEIAFIHDYDTEIKKKDLFKAMRTGKVRILFGSTPKCGTGTNIQDKLIACHDLDCPWKPADLEQRAGRILRQGNQNPEVDIYRYVTKGTFDSYLFQTVERKQKFIGQVMTGKSPSRVCDDVDGSALSYAEIKALCAGNPLIAEKMSLDNDITRLKLLKSDHRSKQYHLEDIVLNTQPIEQSRQSINGYKADLERLNAHGKSTHHWDDNAGANPMIINGLAYTTRKEAGEALITASRKTATQVSLTKIGEYHGFELYAHYSVHDSAYALTAKGAMSYSVVLGGDSTGNVIRIDNALEKIEVKLNEQELLLERTIKNIEDAKNELGKPFIYEAELNEKLQRLAEVDALLNIGDDKGEDVIGLDIEEDDISESTGEEIESTIDEQGAQQAEASQYETQEPTSAHKPVEINAPQPRKGGR